MVVRNKNKFSFKQFSIVQEKSAMKVGIDSVLFGAWINVNNANRILDIGTGTGLLSLMLAQRSDAIIDAVEIDEGAASEASVNVAASPWSEQIEVYQTDFVQYTLLCEHQYDLIISNPPYFENSLEAATEERTRARHSSSLSFEDLICCVEKLLTIDGRLALILPVNEAERIIAIAKKYQLHLNQLVKVKPNSRKAVNRYLMEFSRTDIDIKEEEITIYGDQKSGYSAFFEQLTKSYYLFL
ncbi:methyltransferase domain-containing protein [Puteibacter caeruleilacunae]|nr:methyltransferase domain-containing protein [Puteibacter caeruleilacunae]